jgi:predicted MFS family arabinose efflux permease
MTKKELTRTLLISLFGGFSFILLSFFTEPDWKVSIMVAFFFFGAGIAAAPLFYKFWYRNPD